LIQEKNFLKKGISGTVEGLDRPAFSDLIEHVENNQSNQFVIVVERMDRLARC